MMEGTVMVNNEAIEKAKNHFAQIVAEQLERVERMKAGDTWVDYSSLKPIIIGVVGGDGIERRYMASKDKEVGEDQDEAAKEPSKKKKGLIKWILIGLGLVLLIGVSVGTSIYFMSNMLHGKSTAQEAAPNEEAKGKEDNLWALGSI